MGTGDARIGFYRSAFGGSWMTQGLWVAAELGIADLLDGGPLPVGDLAEKTGTHAPSLYRLLRALASVGVFAQDGQGRFVLTPLAELLKTRVPNSQRAFAIMMGSEFCAAWGELLHSVRTGEAGFRKRYGVPFFEYMTGRPERHTYYDAAMTSVHGVETVPILEAYDFSGFGTVVDVGGGNGGMLEGILDRHPSVRGVLFDLPSVADRSREAELGLKFDGRVRFEGGDFFASVPAGADAYVLRHIIHDWQDEDAVTILRNCRDAMNPEGRILVVEMVIPPGNQPGFGKWLDLMMLLVDGRERTEEEYGKLFSKAGLTLNRVVPTASDVSVVEGIRAA